MAVERQGSNLAVAVCRCVFAAGLPSLGDSHGTCARVRVSGGVREGVDCQGLGWCDQQLGVCDWCCATGATVAGARCTMDYQYLLHSLMRAVCVCG
jgi:hypothetical protein